MWIAAMTPWQLVKQLLWYTCTPAGRREMARDRARSARTDPAREVACPRCHARFVPS